MAAFPGSSMIRLPDISHEAFALYVQLLYTGRLPSNGRMLTNFWTGELTNIPSNDEYAALIKLFLIPLEDRIAQKIALEAILAKAKEDGVIPSPKHVSMVYEGTDEPCGARKMMVDLYASSATEEMLRDEGFPDGFMQDLAIEFAARRGKAGAVMGDVEYYMDE